MTMKIIPSAERVAALSAVLDTCAEGRTLKRDVSQNHDMGGRHAPATASKTPLTLAFNALSMADDVTELCRLAQPEASEVEVAARAQRIRTQILEVTQGQTDIEQMPVAGAHKPAVASSRAAQPLGSPTRPSRAANELFAHQIGGGVDLSALLTAKQSRPRAPTRSVTLGAV